MRKVITHDNIPEYSAFFSCSMTGLAGDAKNEIYDFLLSLENECKKIVSPTFHAFIPYREEDCFDFQKPHDYYELDTMAVKKSKVFIVFDFHQMYSYGVGVEAKTADDSGKPILLASTKPQELSVMLRGMRNIKSIIQLNSAKQESIDILANAIKLFSEE